MPFRGRTTILIGFGLLLVAAAGLKAQQGGVGSIIGEIRLNRGDFPGRILVELQFRGATVSSQYSDDEGKFGFSGLASNPYHVVIHDERFHPVDQLIVLDTSISIISIAQISLNSRESVRKDLAMDRAQGSNPAVVDLREYRHRFPKNVLKEFDRGVEADREGKHDDAIQHYQKTLALAPEFYPAHNNLGSDYLGKSNFGAAQAQFEQAIKLNQSDAQPYLNLGNVLLMTKDYGRALRNLQEGLRRDPNSALGQFLLGSVYVRLRKFPEAERSLRAALAINPAMTRVRLELVNIYLLEKKNSDASTELKAFLADSPGDPLAPKAKEVLNRLEAAR
jgi:tetratricopeptide (TPR) repeat protein